MGVFCEICNVTVPSEIVMKDHVKGKKHLRLADIVNRQRRQAERSVFVRGFPYGTKDVTLKKFFSKYGPVDLVFVDRERGSYAIIEFRSRDTVELLLQPGQSCFLGNKKLTIKPREVKAYVPKKRPEPLPQAEEEKTEVVEVPKYDLEAILSELHDLENVCAQMRIMRERLKLTEEDMKQREAICQDLETVASSIFTSCKANQFGSSVNGFGMRGCDMDIFLDLNLEQEPKSLESQKTTELPFIKDIKALKVEGGRITHESLCNTSWRDRIKLLGRILGGTAQFGKDVLTIPSARCPVVKVTHQATGMKCDISINNKMALRNTKFLQFLGQEERLGALAYTAKIWAKLKDLTGQGPRITSYTLSLLVIFYLQQTDPPVFPSAAELSRMTADEDKVTLEHWECSFPEKLPPTKNTSSAEELLKGFFEFYSHFDFSNLVINIRDGLAEDLHEFRTKALANVQLETFKYGPMCVQDPFVLDHNTTLNVNAKVKGQLVMEFQEAAAKIAHAKFEDKSNDVWGIPFLLSDEKVRQYRIEEETEIGSLVYSQMPYMFEVDYQPMRFTSDLLKNVYDPHERLKKWTDRICGAYKRLLSEALLFEGTPVTNGANGIEGNAGGQVEKPMSDGGLTDEEKKLSACNHTTNGAKGASEAAIEAIEVTYGCENGAKCVVEDFDPKAENGHGCKETGEKLTKNDGGFHGNSNDHISTKRSLSHESASITSESKKSRSDMSDGDDERCCDRLSAENLSSFSAAAAASTEEDNDTHAATKNMHTDTASTRSISQENQELILHHAHYRTHYRMWSGRKKVKSKVKVNEPDLDLVDLEVKVTAELKEADDIRSEDVVLSFETVAVLHKEEGQTELRFYLQPISGSKEFTCFYAFFRSYFLKISEKLI